MRKSSINNRETPVSQTNALASLTAAMEDLQTALQTLTAMLVTGGDDEKPHMPDTTYRSGTTGTAGTTDQPDEPLDDSDDLAIEPETEEPNSAGELEREPQQPLVPLSANRPEAFLRADPLALAEPIDRLEASAQEPVEPPDPAIEPISRQAEDLRNEGWPGADEMHYPRADAFDYTSMERLAEAIGRLSDSILNGGGRSGSVMHPGEAQGGLNGLLQSARIPARPDGYN